MNKWTSTPRGAEAHTTSEYGTWSSLAAVSSGARHARPETEDADSRRKPAPRAIARRAVPQRIMAYLAANQRVARVIRSMLEPSVTAWASVYSGVGSVGATPNSSSLWMVRMATVYLRATVVACSSAAPVLSNPLGGEHDLPAERAALSPLHDDDPGKAESVLAVAMGGVGEAME